MLDILNLTYTATNGEVAEKIVSYCQSKGFITAVLSNIYTKLFANKITAILFYKESEKVIYGIHLDSENYLNFGNVVDEIDTNGQYTIACCARMSVSELNESKFWKTFSILKEETDRDIKAGNKYSLNIMFEKIDVSHIAKYLYKKSNEYLFSVQMFYPTDSKSKKTSDAQLKSAAKWNKEKSLQISIRAKKEEIEKYSAYAEKVNLKPCKFARAAMQYCIRNNISEKSLMQAFNKESEDGKE